MNTKNFANHLGLTAQSLGLVLSFAGVVGTAAAQTPVVVTNTVGQSVPITGYVYALTNEQQEPVQIALHLNFSTDVAPKAIFTIPALQRLHIQHVSTRCHAPVGGEMEFALRLGTGQDKPFHWYRVFAKTFTYPSFGITWFGFAAEPLEAVFDAGSIWADGIRNTNVGVITYCDVMINGYYTTVPAQVSRGQ